MIEALDLPFLFEAGATYSVKTRHVVGIVPYQKTARLEGLPAHATGVAHVRGAIYVVIDLAVRAGGAALHRPTHIVLIKDGMQPLALLATEIHGPVQSGAPKRSANHLEDPLSHLIKSKTKERLHGAY